VTDGTYVVQQPYKAHRCMCVTHRQESGCSSSLHSMHVCAALHPSVYIVVTSQHAHVSAVISSCGSCHPASCTASYWIQH
jgi:hypothetical protein